MFSNETNDLALNQHENIKSKKANKYNNKQHHHNETSKHKHTVADQTVNLNAAGSINNGFLTDSSTGSNDPADVVYKIPHKSAKRTYPMQNEPISNAISADGMNTLAYGNNLIPSSNILSPNSILIDGIDYASSGQSRKSSIFPLNKKVKNKKSHIFFMHNPVIYIPLIICLLLIFLGIVAGVTFLFIRNETVITNSTSLTDFKNVWVPTVHLNSTSNYSESVSITTQITTQMTQISSLYNNLTSSYQKRSENCGLSKNKPRSKQYRIMNGDRAVPHMWPWVVSIGFFGPKASLAHACGGALINKRFVITASHCVIEYIYLNSNMIFSTSSPLLLNHVFYLQNK